MRDKSIEKSFRREINLRTKTVKDKNKYTRKCKHKNKMLPQKFFRKFLRWHQHSGQCTCLWNELLGFNSLMSHQNNKLMNPCGKLIYGELAHDGKSTGFAIQR